MRFSASVLGRLLGPPDSAPAREAPGKVVAVSVSHYGTEVVRCKFVRWGDAPALLVPCRSLT